MVTATYSIKQPGAQTIFNTASVTSRRPPEYGQQHRHGDDQFACPTSPNTSPAGNAFTGSRSTARSSGAQRPAFQGLPRTGRQRMQTLLGTTSGNSMPYSGLQPAAQYEWRIEGIAANLPHPLQLLRHLHHRSFWPSLRRPPSLQRRHAQLADRL